MERKLPRGLMNHNPLNIRKSRDKFQGLSAVQSDSSFFTFSSNLYGYRAAMCIIRTYMHKYNRRSIADIIKAWAPSFENNTKAYIEQVSRISGISQYVSLYFSKKEEIVSIVYAMALVENGMQNKDLINIKEIEEAYLKV